MPLHVDLQRELRCKSLKREVSPKRLASNAAGLLNERERDGFFWKGDWRKMAVDCNSSGMLMKELEKKREVEKRR